MSSRRSAYTEGDCRQLNFYLGLVFWMALDRPELICTMCKLAFAAVSAPAVLLPAAAYLRLQQIAGQLAAGMSTLDQVDPGRDRAIQVEVPCTGKSWCVGCGSARQSPASCRWIPPRRQKLTARRRCFALLLTSCRETLRRGCHRPVCGCVSW